MLPLTQDLVRRVSKISYRALSTVQAAVNQPTQLTPVSCVSHIKRKLLFHSQFDMLNNRYVSMGARITTNFRTAQLNNSSYTGFKIILNNLMDASHLEGDASAAELRE